ncbi:MAG: cell division protein ZapE [Gammaproteobacteria bacterium]|nr:cell division protein ZapE [Gammaproteobacteria bacterium]
MNRVCASRMYDDLSDGGKVSPDPSQRQALQRLDHLAEQLVLRKVWSGNRKGLFRRQSRESPERGLYLWGGVGRGKTFLMDLFVDSLPEGTAIRLHFHRFMNKVHERLAELQGSENPLETVADEVARSGKVLCLDEFFVSDITDAMILGTLFDGMFRRGVALVTTSNIEPENLYEGGLQRDRFLPAISLIQRYCETFKLDSETDYRLRTLERTSLYFTPCDSNAIDAIWESVFTLVPEATKTEAAFVTINRRRLAVKFVAEDVIWFDFDVICGLGRAVPDYIEIAKLYHTVVIAGVPRLSAACDEVTRRFVHLVDEFYDRSVNLLLAADVTMDQLYVTGRLAFEMDRCRSRLLEMQSVEYLERPHRPH